MHGHRNPSRPQDRHGFVLRTEATRAELYATGHLWPDLRLFDLSDLLEVGIDPADTRTPIRITVKNGPGARQRSGLISPQKGAKMTALQILLSHLDAKRTGLAILHHLQAWATVTYLDRIESETWQPRSVTDLTDTPPPDLLEEPGACGEQCRATDPATGEILALSNTEGSGNGEPALRYGNGSPVSDNPDERMAYRAHVATVKAIPASTDALREWAKALTNST